MLDPFFTSPMEFDAPLRVLGDTYLQALALILTGDARGDDPAVRNFLVFAQENGIAAGEVWATLYKNRPVASALVIPSAGRSAMLFPSPLRSRRLVPAVAMVVRAAVEAQDPAHIHIIQTLLEVDQRLEHAAMLDGGFVDLATLIYMERAPADRSAALTLPEGVAAVTWHESRHDLFAAGILASYEQTLDCPVLLGVREINDIVAGHMATGVFQADLWLALHHEGRPVGVMLLNRLPQRRAVELVYLGLAPEWRGRGLAKSLVNHALALSYRNQCDEVILAVDQVNEPAVRLYHRMGFVATSRKLAMMKALKQ